MLYGEGRSASGGWDQRNTGLQDILKQMQDAQNKANAANEARYAGVLSSLESQGQSQMAGVERQEQQGQAKSAQSMISSGLSGTTMAGAGGAGARQVSMDAEGQRQQIQGNVAQQKAGVMERRTDQGPDLGMFSELLKAAGQQKQPAQKAPVRHHGTANQMQFTGSAYTGSAYTGW